MVLCQPTLVAAITITTAAAITTPSAFGWTRGDGKSRPLTQFPKNRLIATDGSGCGGGRGKCSRRV